ncbi:nucleoporin NUP188 [Hyalella azteca]|uniref:Nucleoporin NUP188 n=1 Tax=Hyalella azteca TaxID=294128 RepID=A0A8B7NGD4_HYAAZ|nr:nucleoporin NUP188 [Hyalella azteca]
MTSIICGKALWSVVCGTNVLPSNDVVGEELEMAADHLRAGICYYEPFSEEDHHEWIDSSNLKENQKSFVLRLAKMLNLCSRQAWEFFQVFLQEEYRGSIAELTSVLACYRSESHLLHQIFAFYLTDPMHILSCRTHLLASAAAKQDHPYQELFADFVREALDCEQLLGSNMVEELTCVHQAVMKYRDCQDKAYGGGIFGAQEDEANKNKTSALDFVPGNPDLPDDGEYQWLAARLALAKHLLASLLVYYAQPHRKCEPSVVVNLITLAQGEGVCGGVVAPGGQSCQAAVATLLRDIDALHSLLLVLVIDTDEDVRSHKLCAPQWRDQVESLITEFGSRPGHLPPLLAWCVLQGRRALCDTNGASVPSSEVQRYSRMAVRAVDGGVMACLHNFLNNQAVVSDALLKEVCASIVYSVACVAATQLNIDPRAPCSAHLSALAVACVASPVPAHLFWAEEEGTAAVLLPDALLVFVFFIVRYW